MAVVSAVSVWRATASERSASSTWIGAAATSRRTGAMAPSAAAWQPSEARRATASPRSSQRLERILETADRADRRAGGEKPLDRGAGHAAVRRESTEGLVRLVEHVLEPDETGQLPPRGRRPQADEGVAGERRLVVRLVAAEELGADPAEVERERRPAPWVVGEARIHPVLRREGKEVSRPHRLRAAERRGELGALLEGRLGEGVVRVGLDPVARPAAEPDLDPPAPRPSDVLEEEPQDAGRRDGEDVVLDVRPEARDVRLEPVARAGPGAHLPRSGHDGAKGRVGGGPHLKAGADRPRSGTGELEEGGGSEILRVAPVEA